MPGWRRTPRGQIVFSLDGYALGEIARLIDIASSSDCDVIGQQLKRYDFEDRCEKIRRGRYFDYVVRHFAHLGIAFGYDRQNLALPRFDFLDIRQSLLVEQGALRAGGIVRGENHDGQIFVDERVRPMFHFARRVALGVDVGNFLQLESALERDREMDAAPEEKEIVGAEKFAPQIFVLLIVGENGYQLARYAHQLMHEGAGTVFAQAPARLGKVERQDGERGELAGEGFG